MRRCEIDENRSKEDRRISALTSSVLFVFSYLNYKNRTFQTLIALNDAGSFTLSFQQIKNGEKSIRSICMRLRTTCSVNSFTADGHTITANAAQPLNKTHLRSSARSSCRKQSRDCTAQVFPRLRSMYQLKTRSVVHRSRSVHR